MSSYRYKPPGSIALPALMCGVAAGALAIGLDVMGYFTVADAWLKGALEAEPYYLVDPVAVGKSWSYAAALICGWLVAMSVLDTNGWWRRWLVGGMSLMVAVGFCPVLMLWGIFWAPAVLGVAVLWGWFCSMIYVGQHRMPCEGVVDVPVPDLVSEVDGTAGISKIKVETIPFPVPFKGAIDEEDTVDEAERWSPRAGNGAD